MLWACCRHPSHRIQAQNGKTDASEIDAWKGWQDAAQVPTVHSIESTEELADALATKQVQYCVSYMCTVTCMCTGA